jgi:hypothetical protein
MNLGAKGSDRLSRSQSQSEDDIKRVLSPQEKSIIQKASGKSKKHMKSKDD